MNAFTLEKYPNEKRVDTGWGSARYVKATEWRVTNTETGESKSFWSKREATAFIKTEEANNLIGR